MNLFFSLGAVDDGTSGAENCPASDNNIMTPVSGYFINKMILTFSSCSISAFKQTIFNKYV